MPRFLRVPAATLFAMTCITAARAEDVQIAAFFGRYEGTGITEKLESRYYGIMANDFDVEIGQDGAGFFINWMRVDRTSIDPANQEVKRKPQRIQFIASGHSGTYRAATPDAKVDGAFTWATISGQSLTINQMGIDEGGGIELQTYERTLTDLGMVLEVSRVRNYEQLLFLRGRLIKVSN